MTIVPSYQPLRITVNVPRNAYPMARRNALAPPYRQSASKTLMTTTTIATCGSASLQLDRINGRTASMAHVMGLNRANRLIQAGIAANGTNAELKKIIGSERKPNTEKKSPWLFTENAMAIEIAVNPTPNI